MQQKKPEITWVQPIVASGEFQAEPRTSFEPLLQRDVAETGTPAGASHGMLDVARLRKYDPVSHHFRDLRS
jgi:hypothetical protein